MTISIVKGKTVLVVAYVKASDKGKLEKAFELGEANNLKELKAALDDNDVEKRPYVCFLYFDEDNVLHEFPTGLGGALLNFGASFEQLY